MRHWFTRWLWFMHRPPQLTLPPGHDTAPPLWSFTDDPNIGRYYKTGVIRLLVCLVLTLPVAAQERVTLSAPETTPSNTRYRIERLTLTANDEATADVDEGSIHIQLAGVERAGSLSCVYSATTSPTGTTLLTGLNKANLSSAYAGNATTGSLKQRILHRLIVMGEAATVCDRALAGSLSGSVP